MPQMRMNSLKSLAMNCGPLSEMMRGLASGIGFAGALDDGFHVVFLHLFSDLPVDNEAAAAIEDAAEEVKGPGDVEVTDIDVPVLMRPQGLHKAGPLLGGRGRMPGQESRGLEDAIDAGRAACDDIGIEHHEREPAITFQRVLAGEAEDRPPLSASVSQWSRGTQALCSLTLP